MYTFFALNLQHFVGAPRGLGEPAQARERSRKPMIAPGEACEASGSPGEVPEASWKHGRGPGGFVDHRERSGRHQGPRERSIKLRGATEEIREASGPAGSPGRGPGSRHRSRRPRGAPGAVRKASGRLEKIYPDAARILSEEGPLNAYFI